LPELPEVETVRQGLLPLVGQEIVACDIRRRDVIRDQVSGSDNPRRGRIQPNLIGVGSTIDDIKRHGKQMAIITQVSQSQIQSRGIGIHLGMSGQVLVTDAPKISPAKHVHVVWTTSSGIRFAFRDPRRFGKVVLHSSRESLESDWSRLGPDGKNISSKDLRDACNRTTRSIKSALLDQHLIAGVGNIYADEALFEAQINPLTPSNMLSPQQTTMLARSICKILGKAIKARGSTLRDFRDTSNQTGTAQLLHKMYGRAGQPCMSCQSQIQTAQVAQRTTCWCPSCQPL
jgi:formamidopyrimidine-DNA glycosylase